MFDIYDPDQKPDEWGFESGLVGKEWEWFHDGSFKIVAPFWSIDNVVRDISGFQNDLTLFNAPTWGTVNSGLALGFNGTDEYAEIANLDYQSSSSDFTVCFIWTFSVDPANFSKMLSDFDSSNGDEGWGFGERDSDDLALSIGNAGGAEQLVIDSNDMNVGDRYAVFGSWDDSATLFTYIVQINNGPITVQTKAYTTTLNPSSHPLKVAAGNSNVGNPIQHTGIDVELLYIRDRQSSANQLVQLAQDSLGPLRMREAAVVFASLAVFTSTNLALNHSGASDIGGAIGAALTDDSLNNIWDDVSSGDADAGDTEYRCTYVKNTHASLSAVAAQMSISADPTESDFALGLGAAGKNGTETAVANEDTAPAGVTFGSGPLSLGTLAAGDFYPVWIRRTVTAGAGAATPDSGKPDIVANDPN